MLFNCLDDKGDPLDIPKDHVLYVYKAAKYALFVHTDRHQELEWEMMGPIDSASRFLAQFGFARVDSGTIVNMSKIASWSKKKVFGKYEAYFADGSNVTVSRTAHELYSKE